MRSAYAGMPPQFEVNSLNPSLMALYQPYLTSWVPISKVIWDVMNSPAAIHIVSPDEFDRETTQTPGSERRAAIAPALGIASAIWGGTFEVEPGSRTGIHHHGQQETIAYVLSGICEIRWGAKGESAARAKAGDFIHVQIGRASC